MIYADHDGHWYQSVDLVSLLNASTCSCSILERLPHLVIIVANHRALPAS